MDTQLMKETFNTAYNYSFELTKGIDLLSKQIKQDDPSFPQTLHQLIIGLEWYLTAVEKTSTIQNKILDLEVINQHLSNINDAIKNDNVLYISDIFKYEIKESIEEWQGFNRDYYM